MLKEQCQGSCWMNWFGDFSSAWLLVAPEGAKREVQDGLESLNFKKGPTRLLPRGIPLFSFFPSIALKHGNCALLH